jgi:hypothetical protein
MFMGHVNTMHGGGGKQTQPTVRFAVAPPGKAVVLKVSEILGQLNYIASVLKYLLPVSSFLI